MVGMVTMVSRSRGSSSSRYLDGNIFVPMLVVVLSVEGGDADCPLRQRHLRGRVAGQRQAVQAVAVVEKKSAREAAEQAGDTAGKESQHHEVVEVPEGDGPVLGPSQDQSRTWGR